MATAAGTAPQFVTTIDFGTTQCSVAYLIRPDLSPTPSEVDPTVLTLDSARHKRVPSCILFDPSGKKIAFGYEAREQFAALEREERLQHHYFEHVKKNLRYEKDIDRNQKIFALNGKQFFLLDVIAHILHHLKDRLLMELRDHGTDLKASDFDWVITVPAFWKSKGKRMMREAGYMAGLCSDSEPPPIEIAAATRRPPQVEKSSASGKLSLALEPESAAIHCRRKARVAGRGAQYVVRAEKYLVVDIGGGTVDIASHHIVGGCIEEIAPPAGKFLGGTSVNEEFSTFLEEFVDDQNFSRYINESSPENQIRHRADLNELLYTRFEKQKRRFGSEEGRKGYIVEFPRTFTRLYRKALNSKGDMSVKVEDDGYTMRISASKMAEFFQPAVDGIAQLIESHLQKYKIARTIDTIYWVGGFGGCEYLRNQLEARIKKTFLGCSYQFAVSPEPEFAVIRGATASHCDPSILTERGASAIENEPDELVDTPISPQTPIPTITRGGGEAISTSSSTVQEASMLSNQSQQQNSNADSELGESDMAEISKYLGGMATPNILTLGTVLGLNYIKLKNNMKSETFLLDTIYSWLQKEDNVTNTGNPTWKALVDALNSKGVGQAGIAANIAKDKGIS